MKFLVDIEALESILQEEIPFVKSAEYDVIDRLISKCVRFRTYDDYISIWIKSDKNCEETEQLLLDLSRLLEFMHKEITKYKINILIPGDNCSCFTKCPYNSIEHQYEWKTTCPIFRYMLYKHYNIKL